MKSSWVVKNVLFISFVFFVSLQPFSVLAEPSPNYLLYMRLGEKAYQKKDYSKALVYFKQARLNDPTSLEPAQYIDQIKRYIKDQEELQKEALEAAIPSNIAAQEEETLPIVIEEDDEIIFESPKRIPLKSSQLNSRASVKNQILIAENPKQKNETFEDVLLLNDELWANQPNTQLTIEYDRSVILEGKNIERFLVVTEGFVTIERIDQNQIRLRAQKRGVTFVHIWDLERRWTFNVEIIFPLKLTKGFSEAYEELTEESVKPFRFYYANHWSTLYGGEELSELKKQNLIFRQWMTVSGETPYGDSSSTVHFYKFGNDYVATSYSASLDKGRVGNFKDFTVRAFDTSKRFSDFSLPGRNFRGILFDSYAFHRKIKYTVLQGRDQSSFANLTPGLTKKQKIFLEGAQLTLFPDSKNNYTINAARGYGVNRSPELKDKVFSFETRNRLTSTDIYSETAHDEDKWAARIRTNYVTDDRSLVWSFRDIEKGFATISGRPAGRGEVGSNVNYEWQDQQKNFNVYLDLYQDREQENPDNPDYINYDFSAGYGYRFNPKLRYSTSFYYTATPQTISERTNLRFNHAITRTFQWINERNIALTLSNAFQSSRYERSATSEFDRYELGANLQVPLIKHIFAFLAYEYSWVDEINTGEWSNPTVATAGLTYSKTLTDRLSGNANITYRNEENTEGQVSFLSGEDSLSTNVGLDYRVSDGTNVFMEGRLRNVWGESSERNNFNEAELRLGMQSDWDLPFYWNPIGFIKGYVYFDVNRNGMKDENEKGVEGVRVNVGKKNVVTKKDGKYAIRISAKKVKLSIDPATLPPGAFYSTEAKAEADITQSRFHNISFGITTQTGIYGVVYLDANQNQKLDSEDKFISNVEIVLDETEKVKTNTKGDYNFYDVKPGKHTLTLNVNSLSIEYIPLIKIKNKINVKEGITAIFNIPVKKK